ncbi:hypothetical protein [Pseudomonas aeruginosa]|uniref:hypothetical protein n=1 Tax=Pseudomonas aeruginosa TaxID=287 RepID=UPI000AED8256|nr:hypothetical protein [Pseudomonas aeruginosa]
MSPASASIRQRLLALGEPCARTRRRLAGRYRPARELERFYREVGPLDCTLGECGNPFFCRPWPALQRQAGYRWHGISGEACRGWQDDWLVVADQGADPFILETGSGRILFDAAWRRGWDPARASTTCGRWRPAWSASARSERRRRGHPAGRLQRRAPLSQQLVDNCNRSSVRASGRRTSREFGW